MSNEPQNLEEMMARYGRAVIVVDEDSDGIKVMGMGGAHSVDFEGKPKPGVKRPKNDGFDPNEDETIEAKGDGFMCKAYNKMVDQACPECKGGCAPMGYKEAKGFMCKAQNKMVDEACPECKGGCMSMDYKNYELEDEFDSHGFELSNDERKVLFYLSEIDENKFEVDYPKEKDEDSAEEIKVLFDVGFAFARRALTNRRRKKRRKLFGKDADIGDIETKVAPCWDGYVQDGMKKGKRGKMVPNCVPENQAKSFFLDDVEEKGAKLRDPKGGLTSAGRAHFKRKEGANLKPGVKGAANTPEKMRRKGSFLTRFFTNPSGPLKDEKGRPTRLALSAAAWGEPVPSDAAAAARLAEKGRNLLKRYENTKKKEDDREDMRVKQLGPTIGGGGGNNPNDPDKIDKDGDGVVNDGTPDERPAKRKPTDEKLKNSYLEKRRRRHVNRELRKQGVATSKPRSEEERAARSTARESFNQDEDRKRFVRNQLRKQGIKANAKKEDRDENERAARRKARAEYLRRVAAGESKKKPTPGPVPRKYPDGYVPGLPADRYPEPKKDTSIQDNEDRRNRGKSPYIPGRPADRYGRPTKARRPSDGSSERAEDERNKRKRPAGPPAPPRKTPGQIARERLLPGN